MAAVSSVLLGIAAVGAVGAAYNTNKAAKQQGRMNEIQRRQADLNAARQRRDTVRSNRLARSQAVNTAESQGVSRSSGARGGQDSIISQGYSNLGFMDIMSSLSDQASVAAGKGIRASNRASIFGGLSQLAMTFYTPPVRAASDMVKTKAPITYKGDTPWRPNSQITSQNPPA